MVSYSVYKDYTCSGENCEMVSHFIEVYSWQYSILCSIFHDASSETDLFFPCLNEIVDFSFQFVNETDLGTEAVAISNGEGSEVVKWFFPR